MNLTLDPQVATALTAVAAIDDTPADQLASLVIADWLATHHHRFRAAADALAALFPAPEQPAEIHVPDDGQPRHDDPTPDLVEHQEQYDHVDEPEEPPAPTSDHTCRCGRTFGSPQGLGGHRASCPTYREHQLPSGPERLSCGNPGCDFTARAPQGAAAHRRHCPHRAFLPPTHSPEPEPDPDPELKPAAVADPEPKATHTYLDQPPQPVVMATCTVCRSRVPTVRNIPGIGDCCRQCAKDAT